VPSGVRASPGYGRAGKGSNILRLRKSGETFEHPAVTGGRGNVRCCPRPRRAAPQRHAGVSAQVGQLVLHVQRDDRVDGPGDQLVLLQPARHRRQDLRADPLQPRLERAEPERTRLQGGRRQRAPPVRQQKESCCGRPPGGATGGPDRSVGPWPGPRTSVSETAAQSVSGPNSLRVSITSPKSSQRSPLNSMSCMDSMGKPSSAAVFSVTPGSSMSTWTF
jgi:hypothetical protein